MKPEEQRIAIAEACGWRGPYQMEWLREYGREAEDVWAFCGTTASGERDPLPNYLTDLNAMHEAEKKLSERERLLYVEEVGRLVRQELVNKGFNPRGFADRDVIFFHMRATAAQRAEAFLRTLNLWKE